MRDNLEIGELYDFMKEQFIDLKGEFNRKFEELNSCIKEQQKGIDGVKTQTIENTTRLEILDCRAKESSGKVSILEKEIVGVKNRIENLEKTDTRCYMERKDDKKGYLDVRNAIIVGVLITVFSYILSII